MAKICPLMSRAVTISDGGGTPCDRVADMRYENCAKENCAWWIKKEDKFDGSIIDIGWCVMLSFAGKK